MEQGEQFRIGYNFYIVNLNPISCIICNEEYVWGHKCEHNLVAKFDKLL
jgi:hypothetical protein